MLVLGGEPILGRFKVIVSWRIPGKGQSLLCESYDAMCFPYDICIYSFSIDYLYIYIYVSENKYCIHIYVLEGIDLLMHPSTYNHDLPFFSTFTIYIIYSIMNLFVLLPKKHRRTLRCCTSLRVRCLPPLFFWGGPVEVADLAKELETKARHVTTPWMSGFPS